MKRLFTLIALFAVMLGAVAQTENVYLWKNGVYTAHPLSSIDSITFAVPGNPNDKPNDAPNDVTAVDLGLPSGTLWADRNVGADSPEDYGSYFAWGETEPKTTYDWSTYKWCDGSNDTIMTKYCNNSNYGYNGFTDYKTTLDPADDAATINWGKIWRTPTKAELSELKSICTWSQTKSNGINGYKVTGPNGRSIFLPAAGYFAERNLHDASSRGCYMSSSLEDWNPGGYYHLVFVSENIVIGYARRWVGHSVRAVCNLDINSRPLNDYVVDYTNNNTKNCIMNPVPTGRTIHTDKTGKVWNLDYLHLIPSTSLVQPQVTIKIFGTQSGTYDLKIVTLSPRFLIQGTMDAEEVAANDKLYKFRVKLFQRTEEGEMPTMGTYLYVPGTKTRDFESHPLTELATPYDTIDI